MNRLEKRQLKPHWLQRRRRLLGGEEVGGFAGGGIPEAPLTGGPFGRYQESWVEVPPEAPKDGQTYGRNNDAWVLIVGGGGGIDQATADARYVNIDGDIMTGHLGLPINPSASQAVRKDYVDGAITTSISGKADKSYVDTQDALSVLKAGSTMSGFLTLHADPDTAMKAATKQYVDNKVALGGAEISDTAPTAAQGKLWWESDAGGLWLSYNDGNTTQWIGVGGNVAQGNYVSKAGDTITGNISITSPTVSGTPTSGALVVTGGVGIGGALNIAGAVNHNSTTQMGAGLTLFYGNPDITLDRPAIANGCNIQGKIGGVAKWNINLADQTALSGGNAGANFAINRYADTTGAYLDTPLAIFRNDGHVNLASNVASTSPTTGALTVNGGVGINNSLFVNTSILAGGGGIASGNGTNIGLYYFGTPANGIHLNWNSSVANRFAFNGGPVSILSTTSSTSRTTGALVVNGGVGVAGDIEAGGYARFGTNHGSLSLILDRTGGAGPNIGFMVAGVSKWAHGIGAGSGDLEFSLYSYATASIVSRNWSNGTLQLPVNVVSTSYTTGTLVVGGGAGIAGTINAYGGGVFGGSTPPASTNFVVRIGHFGNSPQGAMAFRSNTDPITVLAFENAGGTVSGSVLQNGSSVSYNTTSDVRGKPHREPLSQDYAREVIDALEVMDFDKEGNTLRGIGLVAQQAYSVHKILASPGMTEDEWWGAEKAAPMPFVIANLQLLNKLVDQLMKAR